jgi:predicted thioredoxin/glutaredoxin
VRAIAGARPIEPEDVERYLEGKFGEALDSVRRAMEALARSLQPAELAARAFTFYEHFRPSIPEGVHGWGAKGELNLDRIRELADKD